MSSRRHKLHCNSADLLKAIHWTSVLKASRVELGERQKYVIAQLATYSLPPYAILRAGGRDHAEAARLTVLFLNRVLGGYYSELAVLEDGKLRVFLYTSVVKFIEELAADSIKDDEVVAKVAVEDSYFTSNFDELPAKEFDQPTLFDHWWGRTLNHIIEEKLKVDYSLGRKRDYYQYLVRFSPGKGGAPSYDEVAEALKISVFQVKDEVNMFKRLYREIQKVQVGSILSNSAQSIDEIHYLVGLQRGFEMAR